MNQLYLLSVISTPSYLTAGDYIDRFAKLNKYLSERRDYYSKNTLIKSYFDVLKSTEH